MANKGLKPYTKQISGSVGSISYNVNVNKNDNNLIIQIPLLQSLGINPIGIGLIYNHLDRNVNSNCGFGSGIRHNFEYSLVENSNNITITNSDGSPSVFEIQDDGKYYSKELNMTITKQTVLVDGDSDENHYYVTDKYDNEMYFIESSLKEIKYTNGYKLSYFKESNELLRLELINEGALELISKFTYTTNSNGNVTEIKCMEKTGEFLVEQSKVSLTYNSSNKLIEVVKYIENNITEHYSFIYDDEYIQIFDEIKLYANKINFNNNLITNIQELYYETRFDEDDGIEYIELVEIDRLYLLDYHDSYTKITDRLDNELNVVFNELGLPIYEFDDENNISIVEYNDLKHVTYQSNVMNLNMLRNDIVVTSLINPTNAMDAVIGMEEISEYSEEQDFENLMTRLAYLGFTEYKTMQNTSTISPGKEEYEFEYSGSDDLISVLAYVNENEVDTNEAASASIQCVLYNNDKVVCSNSYHFTNSPQGRLINIGLKAKTNYTHIKVYVEALNKEIKYTNFIICKCDFGTYYLYDVNGNVLNVKNSSDSISYRYNNNLCVSAIDSSGETTIERDNKQNIIKTTRTDNIVTSYQYDKYNQLTEKKITSGDDELYKVNYTYAKGNLVNEIDSEGNEKEYSYDKNRLISSTINEIPTQFQYSNNLTSQIKTLEIPINYYYNDKKELSEIVCNNGSDYKFIYDHKNRLTNVNLNDKKLVEFVYDSNDKLVSKKYGDYNYYSFQYTNELLAAIKYKTYNRYTFNYDEYERVSNIVNILSNITTTYSYDKYDRLTNVSDNEGNSVNYKYNDNDNDIVISRNVKNYKIIEGFNNLTKKNTLYLKELNDFFQQNNRYATSFCLNDYHLRCKKNSQTYTYPLTTTCLIKEYNKMPCLDLIDIPQNGSRKFQIKGPSSARTEGSIGFWFTEGPYASGYNSIVTKYNRNKTKKLHLYSRYGKLGLTYTTKENSIFDSNLTLQNGWNFICFSYSIVENMIYYSIRLNGDYINGSFVLDEEFNYNGNYEFDSNYYFSEVMSYSSTNEGPLMGYLTGFMMSIDTALSASEINKYYEITKNHLTASLYGENNTIDYQVSNIYKPNEAFELFPLHGNPDSLAGKKPDVYEAECENIYKKGEMYSYNKEVKRYVLECGYSKLEYKYNNVSDFTIGMMLYPDNINYEQCVLELFDNTNKYGMYITATGTLKLVIGSYTLNTGEKINKNTWNHISFSYSSSNQKLCYIVNNTKTVKDIGRTIALQNPILRVGNNSLYNKPYYGQMEMLTTASIYTEDLESLKDSLKVVNKTNEFDPLKRLVKTSVNNGGVEYIYNKIEYHTTEAGNYTTKPSKEIIKLTYGYNNSAERTYTYENDKYKYNVTKIVDNVFGDKTYEYDDRGFLTKAEGKVIRYNDNGNIIGYGNKTFTYDTQIKDRLMSVNGNNIIYSTSNPLLPARYKNFDFEYEGNRLVNIVDDSYSDYTKYISYYYNHEGLRIKKVITKEYFDESLDPEYETTSYYYEGNRLITEYKNSNDRLDFLYDNNGVLYGFIQNQTTTYYYVRDLLQNILGIIDTNGNLVVKYNCNAYGGELEVIPNTQHGSYTASIYKTLGERNPFRYKGYYYDEETQLFYCNSRYYSPELCRFISPDDVGYLDPTSINGLNLYAYCMNDPINYADPSGHWVETVFDLFSLGVSIVEVIINPYDPLNWAGLAGDALDLIPFVTGVGETVRGVKVVAKGVDMADDVYDTIKIMKVADLTDDAWDTVRGLDRAGDFTQSTMSAGRRIHKGYKFDLPGKEYGKIPGIRMDYFDKAGKLVYELKPYNVKSLKAGVSQLSRYRRTMGKGYTWILELY